MTIFGAIVEPDRALVWTDTETYIDRQPHAEMPKMGVNPLGILCVGSGSVSLIRAAASVVHRSMDIDAVERDMPGRLRSRAAEIAATCTTSEPGWFHGQSVVAVGFSAVAGRMLGWQFSGGNFFAPALCSRIAKPSSDEIESLLSGIGALDHIVRLARRQMCRLRENGLEGATGGTLTIAEVTESAVRCWKIPDFDVLPLTAPALPPSTATPSVEQVSSAGAVGPAREGIDASFR